MSEERVVCRVKGCGTAVAFKKAYLCNHHDQLWVASPERKRMFLSASAAQSAIADFVTRTSAEQDASPTASSVSTTTSGSSV